MCLTNPCNASFRRKARNIMTVKSKTVCPRWKIPRWFDTNIGVFPEGVIPWQIIFKINILQEIQFARWNPEIPGWTFSNMVFFKRATIQYSIFQEGNFSMYNFPSQTGKITKICWLNPLGLKKKREHRCSGCIVYHRSLYQFSWCFSDCSQLSVSCALTFDL